MKILKHKHTTKILKFILFLVIVGFLIKSGIKNGSQINWETFQVRLPKIIEALIILAIGNIALAYNWHNLLPNVTLNTLKSIHYWTLSQLGKYLPGTLWFAVGRTYFLKRENITTEAALTSMLMEAMLVSTSAVVVGVSIITIYIQHQYSIVGILLAITMTIISIAFPNKIIHLFNIIVAKCKKKQTTPLHIPKKKITKTFLQYLITWILIGAGFSIFLNGIYINTFSIMYLIGTFIISWSIGYLIFFIPGGIGIREAVIVSLLSTKIPAEDALMIAIATRLWWIIGEILTIIIVSIAYKFTKKRNGNPL